MKKFLLNIGLFTLVLSCFYGVIFIVTPTGSWGADYVRVSSPQYSSLILGSSMAARGLSPSVVQQVLENYYEFPMMNFSFNIGIPYGEVYFNRIAEKLKDNKNKNSLFLISVDPYTIADYQTNEINNNFKREKNVFLAQLRSVTSQPNWEYFLKHILLSKKFVTKQKISCDKYGFDSSLLNMETDTEQNVRERIETIVLPWYEKDVIPNYRFSEERLSYLSKIVNLLKENGDVFLIRMPFEAELLKITDSISPNFDKDMQDFANVHNVNYISFWGNTSKYRTTDGVHLYKEEAERFTKDICDSIKVLKNR